jgi:sigma-B regulation protein RsbU (phosphoserine phosphatase)
MVSLEYIDILNDEVLFEETCGEQVVKQRKILIVDDQPVNLKLLAGILTNSGYDVIQASGGAEARKLAEEFRPEMILLDVMMPEESGFDTCKELKKNLVTADIPVIFLTGLGDVSDKVNGLDLGAVDYITKPFDAVEVLARIKTQLKFLDAKNSIIKAQASRLEQVQTAQQAMLVKPSKMPDANFAVEYVTVLEAGGDFYDVVELGEDCYGYFVADVSGHDLGASFVTSSLKALFRQHATGEHSVSETLDRMNRILCSITPPDVYLTAVYAILDRKQKTLQYGCAGHPAPVYASADGHARALEGIGDMIGAFGNIEIETYTLSVNAGDRIYLYSDGLTEVHAGDIASRDISLEKMCSVCSLGVGMPLVDVVPWVVSGVCGNKAPDDDIVLLGIEV